MLVQSLPDLAALDQSSFPLHPLDESSVHVLLYISGKCHDCDGDLSLFDRESSSDLWRLVDGVRRRLEEGAGDKNRFLCLCPLDFPSRSSTETEL